MKLFVEKIGPLEGCAMSAFIRPFKIFNVPGYGAAISSIDVSRIRPVMAV